jgi:hypothetical protein
MMTVPAAAERARPRTVDVRGLAGRADVSHLLSSQCANGSPRRVPLSRGARSRTGSSLVLEIRRLFVASPHRCSVVLTRSRPQVRSPGAASASWPCAATSPAPFPSSRPASTGMGRIASRARCLATRYSTNVLSCNGFYYTVGGTSAGLNVFPLEAGPAERPCLQLGSQPACPGDRDPTNPSPARGCRHTDTGCEQQDGKADQGRARPGAARGQPGWPDGLHARSEHIRRTGPGNAVQDAVQEAAVGAGPGHSDQRRDELCRKADKERPVAGGPGSP